MAEIIISHGRDCNCHEYFFDVLLYSIRICLLRDINHLFLEYYYYESILWSRVRHFD